MDPSGRDATAEAFLDNLKQGDFAAANQKSREGVAGLRALVAKHHPEQLRIPQHRHQEEKPGETYP
jgi:hypothetical protein